MQELKENILARLIEKGGLYGLVAKHYAGNEVYSTKIIIECFEQCHHDESMRFWGKELVGDIIEYRFMLLAEQRKQFREVLEMSM